MTAMSEMTLPARVSRLAAYSGAAIVVVGLGSHADSVGDVASWWAAPLVYQKLVVWTVLWGLLGLAGEAQLFGSGRRSQVGGPAHWVRPGTIRLPPWPGRIAFTSGTRRTVGDVGLYVGAVVCAVVLLATYSSGRHGYATLQRPWLWAMLGCLALLGLRDKSVFLAARPERYALLLLVIVFDPANLIFSLKLCLLALWWGAAVATVNRQFPYVVAARIGGTPWLSDLRPSAAVRVVAWSVTAFAFVLPAVLITSRGGWLAALAVGLMVVLNAAEALTLPSGAPLEWNVFASASTLVLFGHYAGVGAGSLASVAPAVLLIAIVVGLLVLGHVKPHLVARQGILAQESGNVASSLWLLRDDVTWANLPNPPARPRQRSILPSRRALDGLLARAVDDPGRYTPVDGEAVAAAVLGQGLGDGHLHGEQLLHAVQERCEFTPGQLRVVTLESQPVHRPTLRYRITDAAAGKREEGTVRLRDVLARRPWPEDDAPVPVRIRFQVLPAPIHRAPVACPRPRPRPVPAFASPTPAPRPRPHPEMSTVLR